MTLRITDTETERLACELATLSGEPVENAVRKAVERRLDELRTVEQAEFDRLYRGGLAIARHCASSPELYPGPYEDLMYDEWGLPR